MQASNLDDRLNAIESLERKIIAGGMLLVFTGYFIASELTKHEARQTSRIRTAKTAAKRMVRRGVRENEYYLVSN